jgi:hypothetical protein
LSPSLSNFQSYIFPSQGATYLFYLFVGLYKELSSNVSEFCLDTDCSACNML